LFDHHWDDEDTPLDKEPGDPNAYSTGVIGRHNVVLSYMPGMGIANAAAVASNCRKSFPGIKLALVVGICGVVPFKLNKDEIVLGDVIVSDGIVQYDFGRQLPDHFARKDTLLDSLGRPNQEIRGVLAKHRRQLSTKIVEYLDVLRQEPELRAEYPGITQDRLFEASYRHAEDQKSCEQLGCNGELVLRRRLETAGVRPTPAVHFGLMASGNSVTKSGKDRDRIAAQEGVIAFEIEGADVWDSFPCIIIKGACDYADSHKSKVWQRYAAATAAACAKAFLSFWVPSNLSEHVSFTHLSQDQAMFLVPFARNDLFVGRNDILERLRSLLFEKNNRKVALFGLGGTGKTQIALELAYWVKETKPDYSVFWMPVLSMADFEGKCKMLVKAFGIQCSEGDDAKEAMRQHFSSKNAGKWFLIVDNADDMEILYKATHAGGGILDFLPFSDDGRILFTTRSKQVAVVAARNDVVKLSHMRRGEASDLLKKFLIDQDELHDNENVAQLLDILTYLPLAIAQAAAYMNIYEVSIKEYIQLLQHEDGEYVIELLEEGHYDGSHYDSSQAAVATTWIVSFEQIRRSAPLAADLLSFMAFIEPKAIPRSILPGLKTEQKMTQAIGTLLGHGFLSQRGREPMFDMHSLVHLVTRRWTENQGLGIEMQKLTLARVADVFPTAEWEHRDLWRQYLPHAIRLLRTTAGVKNEAFCNLGYQVGRCLLVDGRIEEAVAILENVIAIGEMTLEEDHLSQLASQHALAEAYQANGQIKEAVKLLEHMTAIWRKTLAGDHPSRLASQHELARAYLADGQVKDAVELLKHVVKINEKTLAGDHPSRLASQHELARAYLADSQIGKAVDMLEHIVAIKEKIQAEDHPSRLASQHALAGAYQADGQIKKAVELLEHVVAIREKALEEDHPDRLMSERELAMAYETNGWTGNDSYNSASETSSLSWSNNEGSTHLSSLSYGSFATQHQTAESRPTMTFFRYKKPEAEHETGTRDDDIQSIASISDDINSLAEAKYDKMANIRHAAMTYFVSTLAGIPGLLSLYEKAVKVMDEAKFVRNHRRMLKTYYLGLRAEGRTPSELLAIQFLRPRSNRTQISIQICHLVTSTESTVREQVTALLEQEKDNLLMIDRFLSERSYTGRQALPNHIHYTSHADSTRKHGENSDFDSDTDSDLDGNLDEKHETQFEENDVLSALEATKEFFVNGRPFRAYQDRMHEFLNLARVTTEQQGSFRPSAFGRGLESLKVAPRERGAMDRKTAMKMTVSSWWLWLMTKCCPPPAGYHRIPYICVSFFLFFAYRH
jgi:nucleoside phosphorylase/tetratricopeptide (TPR) repeat protein